MALRVITDTSCDLPAEILSQYGIDMIPLRVTFADGSTYLDRLELPAEAFARKMANYSTLPKTAAPDPATFIEHFKKGIEEAGQVLFVSLSSALSSTYQTAQMACNMLGDKRVRVFDTLTASLGTGIMAIRAVEMDRKGMNLETLIARLQEIRERSEVIFTLDTLDNIVKGGRLSRIEGKAASILNIKPIFRGFNGKPELIQKVRGRKKAVRHILNLVEDLPSDGLNQRIVGITHVNCEDEALELYREIEERFQPEDILLSEMSATIGTYAGQGGLMVNF